VIDPLWESASQKNNHTTISLEPELANKKDLTDEGFILRAKKFVSGIMPKGKNNRTVVKTV